MNPQLVFDVVTEAALRAGLPDAARVMNKTRKDNLTLVRPRLELQFLSERFTRTGRKLGIRREEAAKVRKRELYEVDLGVAAQVFAEDRDWLETFATSFAAALPRGFNDDRGNWVKVRVQEARLQRPLDNRVSDEVIQVFSRVDKLFSLSFVWRVTDEERTAWIRELTINASMGDAYGNKQKNQ